MAFLVTPGRYILPENKNHEKRAAALFFSGLQEKGSRCYLWN
jgi:hypothetical protein